jgi:sortase B
MDWKKIFNRLFLIIIIAGVGYFGRFVAKDRLSKKKEHDNFKQAKGIVEQQSKNVDLMKNGNDSNKDSDINYSKSIDDMRAKYGNDDIVGIIEFPKLDINYIILQGENNEFYLDKDVYKNYAETGSIFLDMINNPDFEDYNSIVYGHYMYTQGMFKNLVDYKDQAVADKGDNIFYITSKNGREAYEVFAFNKRRALEEYYKVDYEEGYMQEVLDSSLTDFHFDKDVNEGKKFVTLSTCIPYHTNNDYRYTVTGMLNEELTDRGKQD